MESKMFSCRCSCLARGKKAEMTVSPGCVWAVLYITVPSSSCIIWTVDYTVSFGSRRYCTCQEVIQYTTNYNDWANFVELSLVPKVYGCCFWYPAIASFEKGA